MLPRFSRDPQFRGPRSLQERQMAENKGNPSGSRSEQARERGNHSSQDNNSERSGHQVQGSSGEAQQGVRNQPDDESGSPSGGEGQSGNR
jgi:hypothetical protein